MQAKFVLVIQCMITGHIKRVVGPYKSLKEAKTNSKILSSNDDMSTEGCRFVPFSISNQ